MARLISRDRLVRSKTAGLHRLENAVGGLPDHQVLGDPAAPFVVDPPRAGRIGLGCRAARGHGVSGPADVLRARRRNLRVRVPVPSSSAGSIMTVAT